MIRNCERGLKKWIGKTILYTHRYTFARYLLRSLFLYYFVSSIFVEIVFSFKIMICLLALLVLTGWGNAVNQIRWFNCHLLALLLKNVCEVFHFILSYLLFTWHIPQWQMFLFLFSFAAHTFTCQHVSIRIFATRETKRCWSLNFKQQLF